jgi:hypothetical protein
MVPEGTAIEGTSGDSTFNTRGQAMERTTPPSTRSAAPVVAAAAALHT